MTTLPSVGDALRAAAPRLRASGSRSPRLDAELLLASALGVPRAELFREPGRALQPDEAARFEDLSAGGRPGAGRLHPRPPRVPHHRPRGDAGRAHPAPGDGDAGRGRARGARGDAHRRAGPRGRAARARRRHRLGAAWRWRSPPRTPSCASSPRTWTPARSRWRAATARASASRAAWSSCSPTCSPTSASGRSTSSSPTRRTSLPTSTSRSSPTCATTNRGSRCTAASTASTSTAA